MALYVRPCADCGLYTGSFCFGCFVHGRVMDDAWSPAQGTALCISCDSEHVACHYCRGAQWCRPRPHGHLCEAIKAAQERMARYEEQNPGRRQQQETPVQQQSE